MHTEKVRAAPFVQLAQECVLVMQLQAETCRFVMSKKGLKRFIAFSYTAHQRSAKILHPAHPWAQGGQLPNSKANQHSLHWGNL
jgi:hypothetical protein